MKPGLPDLNRFEQRVFQRRDVLGYLLAFSRRLLGARFAGIMYGTDETREKFLPPSTWDRAVMDQFNGNGLAGLALKWFGPAWVSLNGLSPIRMYAKDPFGEIKETRGVIAHVLRQRQDYYAKDIRVLIIDHIPWDEIAVNPSANLSIKSYDGASFEKQTNIRANLAIVKRFKPANFMSAYIPDYGAIIFHTIDPQLLETADDRYIRHGQLKARLDMLILAIETASLAYLGTAKGRKAVKMIRRKERHLRRAFAKVARQEKELDEQRRSLRAVGGVTAGQLDMEPASVPDGVYAFMDMVGSAKIRYLLNPGDFFKVLTFCHEIAAETAGITGCRLDNFLGDAVFLENVSLFDPPGGRAPSNFQERLMILTLALAAIFRQVRELAGGNHPMDREKRVHTILESHGLGIGFRAGMAWGPALIGPLGSSNRRIITAIGASVNKASRLESTGAADRIHVSGDEMAMLKNAVVGRSSDRLWHLAAVLGAKDPETPRMDMPFIRFLQETFNLGRNMIHEQTHVAYKEFVQDTTYLIDCRPCENGIRFCPGI